MSTLRIPWPKALRCPSDVAFALGASLLWLLVYNTEFWTRTLQAMWHPTFGAALFIGTLFALVWLVQATLILIMPTRALMRAAASALFIVAALSSWFCSAYGAVMTKDMMRNVLQTDPSEVSGLLNSSFVGYFLLLGIVPAVLVWRIRLPAIPWRLQLRQRAIFIGAALVVIVGGLLASSANYAVFFREYKPIRYALMPAAPVTSLVGLLSEHEGRQPKQLVDLSGKVAHTGDPHAKPLLLFLVVGETARAANFQLGGYPRATNPRLQALDSVVYFDQVTSCGTATAISVPCMFSPFSRGDFDVDEASHYTNLLDSLARGGFDIEWRDNNAGCKGVCARVAQRNYADRPDPALCQEAYCYDEVMLSDLPAKLEHLQRDTVIVFHQIGSHGPAYAQRYPPQFERFKPACRSNQLQQCTPESVINAYDNTIAYTDHVLAEQIEMLARLDGQVDSLLIYVSDHGESLGEQGMYLHGMPYAFAPQTQKEVPMLLWASPGYLNRTALETGCLRQRAAAPASHDNLYHTLLGAAELQDQAYDPQLDLLSGCRRGAGPGDHE
jgi:lipid A ethanolaminephosphotransferase